METTESKALDHVLKDKADGDRRLFFRTSNDKDAEKIRAFLAGAPNKETRIVLQTMIQASMFGARCELGRKIVTYPNKWHNGVYIEVKQ